MRAEVKIYVNLIVGHSMPPRPLIAPLCLEISKLILGWTALGLYPFMGLAIVPWQVGVSEPLHALHEEQTIATRFLRASWIVIPGFPARATASRMQRNRGNR